MSDETTAPESLPSRSVIRDKRGEVWVVQPDGVTTPGFAGVHPFTQVALPAIVLWRPGLIAHITYKGVVLCGAELTGSDPAGLPICPECAWKAIDLLAGTSDHPAVENVPEWDWSWGWASEDSRSRVSCIGSKFLAVEEARDRAKIAPTVLYRRPILRGSWERVESEATS